MKSIKMKSIGCLLVLMILLSIQPVNGEVIPIYVGLDSINDSVTMSVNLSVNNYSIYVNAQGYITYSVAYFSISRDDFVYFTVSSDDSSHEEYGRLVVAETGEYNFTFRLSFPSDDEYVNYEVILSEIEIIYQTKTSIIAEAPYGLGFVFLAMVCLMLFKISRRKERKH